MKTNINLKWNDLISPTMIHKEYLTPTIDGGVITRAENPSITAEKFQKVTYSKKL